MDKIDTGFALRLGGMLALCGVVVGLGMLLQFKAVITTRVSPAAFLLAAGIGAGGAGLLAHALFGRQGWAGWALACVGAVLATGVGAWIAALLVVPHQHDLGLFAVILSIGTPVLPLWAGAMVLVQRHAMTLRKRG